jgi:hypothetical protein
MRHGVEGELFAIPARALGGLFIFATALSLWHNAFNLQQMDFISFWAAARLALDGHPAAAWDIAAHKAVQDGLRQFTGLMSFAYPPPFLLMLLPFGLLPYVLAAPVWIAGSYAALFGAARRLLPDSGWLIAAFPPVLLNGIVGQNGMLTAALFIAGALALPKRPFLAGLLLGCLVIKPQLALLLPFALAAGREWRAFAGAACSSLGLLLLALLAFGSQAYAAMFEIAPFYSRIAADGLSGWHKMASVYASLRLAGLPATLAWAGQGAAALAAAALVCAIWRRDLETPAKVAALAAGSMLVSPYLYIYDMVLLIAPFFWLAAQGEDRRLLAALWCLPLVGIAQMWGFNDTVNLMPLAPAALLFLLARRLLATGSPPAPAPSSRAPAAPSLR